MISLAALPLILFAGLVCVAALSDLTSYIIPNWISAALLAAFPLAALAAGLHWGVVAQHAAVGGVALIAGMGMFALNWMGGGDAKLFSASALWIGVQGLPHYLVAAAFAGAALTIGLIMARKLFAMAPAVAAPGWVQTLLSPKGDVPYGIALAAGALIALPQTQLFAAAL